MIKSPCLLWATKPPPSLLLLLLLVVLLAAALTNPVLQPGSPGPNYTVMAACWLFRSASLAPNAKPAVTSSVGYAYCYQHNVYCTVATGRVAAHDLDIWQLPVS